LKDVAGKYNPRNTLIFFCCDILLTIFSSGNVDEAPTTGRSKQTNFLQIFKSQKKVDLLIPATSFGKLVKQNIIQNLKRKNFCNKRFYSDFHVRYHTTAILHPDCSTRREDIQNPICDTVHTHSMEKRPSHNNCFHSRRCFHTMRCFI